MHDPEFDGPKKSRTSPWLWSLLRDRQVAVVGAAVGLQFAVLLGIVLANTVPWRGGATVLLRVVPVDPRDLMRGDYVILSYEFNRVNAASVSGLSPSGNVNDAVGREIFVSLEPDPDGQHYHAGAVTADRPASGRFIRGTLTSPYRASFGIESYYVQEGKGKGYEQAIRRNQLSAEVALAPDGRAALQRLIEE